LHGQAHQAPLGDVVQVAFDPVPLGVERVREPRPRPAASPDAAGRSAGARWPVVTP
jgi:hypothetical protein